MVIPKTREKHLAARKIQTWFWCCSPTSRPCPGPAPEPSRATEETPPASLQRAGAAGLDQLSPELIPAGRRSGVEGSWQCQLTPQGQAGHGVGLRLTAGLYQAKAHLSFCVENQRRQGGYVGHRSSPKGWQMAPAALPT